MFVVAVVVVMMFVLRCLTLSRRGSLEEDTRWDRLYGNPGLGFFSKKSFKDAGLSRT